MLAALFAIGVASANPYAGGGPVTASPKQPFSWECPTFATSEVACTLRIPAGFAIYQDRIAIRAVDASDVKLGALVFPKPKLAQDPSNPEEWRALYDADVTITVPVSGVGPIELELEHQGCQKGLCWPPTTTRRVVKVISSG